MVAEQGLNHAHSSQLYACPLCLLLQLLWLNPSPRAGLALLCLGAEAGEAAASVERAQGCSTVPCQTPLSALRPKFLSILMLLWFPCAWARPLVQCKLLSSYEEGVPSQRHSDGRNVGS